MPLPETTEVQLSAAQLPKEQTSSSPSLQPPAATNPASASMKCLRPSEQEDTRHFDPFTNAKPYSPFYRHATPNFAINNPFEPEASRATRIQQQQQEKAQEHDLERGIAISHSHGTSTTRSKRSKLWKERRSCGERWQSIGKWKRVTLEIGIAVVLVGGMIGIAVGITAAVGGGVFARRE